MDIKVTDLAKVKLADSIKGQDKPLRIYLAGYA